MERHELEELHYIAAIENVASILQHGILCHNLAERVHHRDVSMAEVQDIRRGKRLPNGRLLHEYANVYFQARNPMLYKLLDLRHELAVLRVHASALDIPGAVVADGNAAVSFTAFQPAPEGLAIVDRATTFAERWTDPDPWEYRRRKAASCAELLVPDLIPPNYVVGAWVASIHGLRAFRALDVPLEALRTKRLFFQV
jgi:ssDNA thymidine ADP-ribosyltransferase, DarT